MHLQEKKRAKESSKAEAKPKAQAPAHRAKGHKKEASELSPLNVQWESSGKQSGMHYSYFFL